MSGVNGDGSAFQSHHLPTFNYSHRCSGQGAHVAHQGFAFVQSGLDFVKDTIMNPYLPVAVPCLFQTPSLTTQRKWVTAVQTRKLKNTLRVTALWCWVPKSWSHKGTWSKWDIQRMSIYSCLMQSARVFLQSLQKEKPGWSWLEEHVLWRPLPAPLSMPEFQHILVTRRG